MTLGDVLIVVAVLGAVLACPAMMWIQGRRGRSAGCCPPLRSGPQIQAADLEALRRRRKQIEAQLAEAEGPAQAGVGGRSQPAG